MNGENTTQCTIRVVPERPLDFTDAVGAQVPADAPTALDRAIARTLTAYAEAAEKLLEGKYSAHRELAPPHMQKPCNIFIVRCTDGILVRYDLSSNAVSRVGGANPSSRLAEISPLLSESIIYFPQDPQTYIPPPGGIELQLMRTDSKTGVTDVPVKLRPLIYAKNELPADFKMPRPPARPPCLVSISNDIDFGLEGALIPSEAPMNSSAPGAQQFILHTRFRLPVGWQRIDIYPILGEEYWKPEYAATWAELDLLASMAKKNALAATLRGIDSSTALRKYYAAILGEFETLLAGPEEPVHQFLKDHPELLCPTFESKWSKLPFGNRVSDFVFREAYRDYLLVEIEAPIRKLFRKDGQQRQELTHAINQIADWTQYVADNKNTVEQKLGLVGISSTPRALIVIGRSASLTEENRRKLATIEGQLNKLRILTYDDLAATARANLERILGPLSFQSQNAEVYYYRPV